jgi:hypothetical protein
MGVNISIYDTHMKHRCYFISAMCGLSLYNWYAYSLFDPINNSFFTPYYQNCLLMLFYLGWDTYNMTMSVNRDILFRTDLIIHHAVTGMVFLVCINNTALQIDHVLVMESISLMNYIWRNNPYRLKIWRTACICLIRMPLSFWFRLYYNPNVIYPQLEQIRGRLYTPYLICFGNVYIFFILYDVLILYKIYKPVKIK